MSRARRAAERRGRWAELYAAAWLMAKGYRLLGRRLRTPFGEVDLAAFKRGALIIVEVKQRRDLLAGLEAVGPTQQGRLTRAAQALSARWRLLAAPVRFDVIVVGAGLTPRHVRGAWTA
ncbi:MAG: YraN family protein [Alphaproteobacteria bacterium]|nr:YraN family protein [Alphaproteobacteria bacterium]